MTGNKAYLMFAVLWLIAFQTAPSDFLKAIDLVTMCWFLVLSGLACFGKEEK